MLIDATKQYTSISGRGNGKTMMRLAFNIAWSLSKAIGKPVDIKEGYRVLDEYMNERSD